MLFLKKICVVFLIVSFVSSSLNAHPLLRHFEEDRIQNIKLYEGTPVRVSMPSYPKDIIYISQQRARRFLGIDEHGEPLSPPEKMEIETLSLQSPISSEPSPSGASESEDIKIKKVFETKLLSKLEAQEEIQQAVVREFLRCFASPPFDIFFIDFSDLIFCSKSIKGVSLDANVLKSSWVEDNQRYLTTGQVYRVRCLSPRLKSFIMGPSGDEENDVIRQPQGKRGNPFPWLRLFLGDRDLQNEAPHSKDVTLLALMTPLLNPNLALYPDVEEERENSNIFNQLSHLRDIYLNFVLDQEQVKAFHEAYPDDPIWHLFLSPRAFQPGEQAGYDYLNFKMDASTVKKFLKKNPKQPLLCLFASPLTFEARMRFSLLKGMAQKMYQVQGILKVLFPESLSPSRSRPSSRARAVSTYTTIAQFLDYVKPKDSNTIKASQWESASEVYGHLLQDFFDVENAESLQDADILNDHFHIYAQRLDDGILRFESKDSKIAPEELRLNSKMQKWIYDLLKNPKINFKNALHWAIYFGFDVNYKPFPQASSLLMEYTQRDNAQAVELLLDSGAFCLEEDNRSPLDEAIRRRFKAVFCELLRKSIGRPLRPTHLCHPQEALRWSHDLQFQGALDVDYEVAFNTLSEQHASFGWERLLDQFLIRNHFHEAWKAAEEQKLRDVRNRLSSSIEGWQRWLEKEPLNADFLRRFNFEYFVELFGLKTDVKIKESVDKEIQKTKGSMETLSQLQEICPGLASVEEFYLIEMMRCFLEKSLMRTIPFFYGKTLTQMHNELKELAITYILSLLKGTFEPDKIVVVPGYFGHYSLPPYFLGWLNDPQSSPKEGDIFKTRDTEPIKIYPCTKTMTKDQAAHLFLHQLFRSSFFECVKVEGEDGQSKAFSFFYGHETLETAAIEFDEYSGLLTARIGNHDYHVSRRSLSEYLISLLILMPNSHGDGDVLVFLKNGEVNFSFGGRSQDFFSVNPLDSRTNFLPPVKGKNRAILTSHAFSSIAVDKEVSTFFKQLDVDKILVDWIRELTRIQSQMEGEGTHTMPLSHQELSAFYLRLKCLQYAFSHITSPFTHWDLCRYMNPWKAYNLNNSPKRKKTGPRSLRWAQALVSANVDKSLLHQDEQRIKEREEGQGAGKDFEHQEWEPLLEEDGEAGALVEQGGEQHSHPTENTRESAKGVATAEDSGRHENDLENVSLKLTIPSLSGLGENEKLRLVSENFKAWMEDDKIRCWFADMFACFPERARPGEGTFLHQMANSRVSPIFMSIPESEVLQKKDVEALWFRGVSFLTMRNQKFSMQNSDPNTILTSIHAFVSFVSNAVGLFYLDLLGFGDSHLMGRALNFNFSNLHTLLLNRLCLSKLTITAPLLCVLSLEECIYLSDLNLDTPHLKHLNLKGASAFSDKGLSRIINGLSELESLILEGTKVSFLEFREVIPGVSREMFNALTKRLSSEHLGDFLEGKGALSHGTLCGTQDTLSQVGRVVGKTVIGPLRDIRTMGLWVKRTLHRWKSKSPGNITSKSLDMKDLLKAPIASPTATTAAAGAYWGYLPFVAAHPIAFAVTPFAWWLGGSVKSVGREIEEEKRNSEALLGKALARAVLKTGKTSVNFKGVGLGLEGLISFCMNGGMDNLEEIDLEGNDLENIGGEFLKGMFADGEHKHLRIKLGGNNIRWSLLSEIANLTAPDIFPQPNAPGLQEVERPSGVNPGSQGIDENSPGNDANLSSAALGPKEQTREKALDTEHPENDKAEASIAEEGAIGAAATAVLPATPSSVPSSPQKFFGLHINGIVGPFQMRALLSVLEHLETKLGKRLGDFFHVISGSNGGGGLAVALGQKIPSSFLFRSERSSIPVERLKTIFEDITAHLMPTYNVSGQDPFFSWEAIESAWEKHFKEQPFETSCTAAVTLESDGSPLVLAQPRATGLQAKSIATMLTRFPYPYHVGAVLAHGDQIYESEMIIQTSPSLVAQRIEECFPDVRNKEIFIFSVEGSFYAQDLRNMERNGRKIIKYEFHAEGPHHRVLKFSLPLLPLAGLDETILSSLERYISEWFRTNDLTPFTQ
ncbi:MAG: hypothetical protein JSS34_01605 [Proteobacteria bacterium]|nr:hypothetical protein [Pseudomonadota bacterium]